MHVSTVLHFLGELLYLLTEPGQRGLNYRSVSGLFNPYSNPNNRNAFAQG